VWQPAPAPRFSRTPGKVLSCAATIGQHTEEILQGSGFTPEQIAQLLESGAIVQYSA
jgi:alpha-methylacyl-CoA racemase